jgi:hypothetical protein
MTSKKLYNNYKSRFETGKWLKYYLKKRVCRFIKHNKNELCKEIEE